MCLSVFHLSQQLFPSSALRWRPQSKKGVPSFVHLGCCGIPYLNIRATSRTQPCTSLSWHSCLPLLGFWEENTGDPFVKALCVRACCLAAWQKRATLRSICTGSLRVGVWTSCSWLGQCEAVPEPHRRPRCSSNRIEMGKHSPASNL